MNDIKTIKNWSRDERPREKLISLGKSTLSNTELLAILISTGTKKKSALEIGREILARADNDLMNLSKWSISDYCKIEGIGEAKAIAISAALELAARRISSKAKELETIKSSYDAYLLMKQRLEDLNHEEFWLINLNRKNSVINQYKISEGGITATIVDQRKLFKLAIESNSTGIILFHNHPSGNIQPSDADNRITKTLVESGKLLDIKVLDHIIIAQNGYFSYADNGQM